MVLDANSAKSDPTRHRRMPLLRVRPDLSTARRLPVGRRPGSPRPATGMARPLPVLPGGVTIQRTRGRGDAPDRGPLAHRAVLLRWANQTTCGCTNSRHGPRRCRRRSWPWPNPGGDHHDEEWVGCQRRHERRGGAAASAWFRPTDRCTLPGGGIVVAAQPHGRQFADLGNPSITRGSLVTTDNGDLACDDDKGRVLTEPTEFNGRCSRDRR